MILLNILIQVLHITTAVVTRSQVQQNFDKDLMLFLHFLVMASALLCFSTTHEFCHTCEYAVHSSQATVHEVGVVNLEKPVVSLVLLHCPVPEQLVWVPLFVLAGTLVLFLFYLTNLRGAIVLWIIFEDKFFRFLGLGCFDVTFLI